jgi:hypothetical protein
MHRLSPAGACAFAAALALAGCAAHPVTPVGSGQVGLSVRWAVPAASGADSLIDRLTATGLGPDGSATGDSADLTLLPDRTFRGQLSLHSGAGRSVLVRAFAHGDEFYRGVSDPVTVRPDDSVHVSVTLAPSVTLRLSQVVRPTIFGDSVDLALRLTSTAALRGVQADVTFNPSMLTFGRALGHTALLSGFDLASLAPGRLRLVLYGTAAAERVAAGDGTVLCVLRFASCQLGVCTFVRTSPVGLSAVNAAGAHGLSQPLTAVADSVEFTP